MAQHAADAGHHGVEEIRKHVRTYIVVFVALAALTVVTVAISYVHLPTPQAIALAVLVASVKAALVALFFMHLISERRVIYAVLVLVAIFFVALMFLPGFTELEQAGWMSRNVP